MSNDPIRYAVVGLGRAGWDIHVKQLRGRPDAKIVAVADPVAERRDQAAAEFGCKTYDKLAGVLKQGDVEVVVVATPSVMHGPDTKKAFKAGKHVVVEKPMAMSVSEAESMIKAANGAGKKLFVHQNYRFNPEFRYIKDTIDSGVLGKLYHIRNYLTQFNRRNDWQTLARNGGGVLNNTCPHMIDQALQFAGSTVKDCMGDLRRLASAGDVEDHVKALIRCENGVTFDMEVTSAQNIPTPLPKWIIAGDCGTLWTDGQTVTTRWFDPRQAGKLEAIDGPAADRKYGNTDKLPWQEKTDKIHETPVPQDFYDNVFGVLRRGEPMAITPESVREVIRAIALIRKGTAFPGKATAPKATQPAGA